MALNKNIAMEQLSKTIGRNIDKFVTDPKNPKKGLLNGIKLLAVPNIALSIPIHDRINMALTKCPQAFMCLVDAIVVATNPELGPGPRLNKEWCGSTEEYLIECNDLFLNAIRVASKQEPRAAIKMPPRSISANSNSSVTFSVTSDSDLEYSEQSDAEEFELSTASRVVSVGADPVLSPIKENAKEETASEASPKVVQPAIQKVEQPAIQKVEQPAIQKVEQPAIQKVEQPAIQKVEQKIEQTVEQTVEQPTIQKIEQKVEQKSPNNAVSSQEIVACKIEQVAQNMPIAVSYTEKAAKNPAPAVELKQAVKPAQKFVKKSTKVERYMIYVENLLKSTGLFENGFFEGKLRFADETCTPQKQDPIQLFLANTASLEASNKDEAFTKEEFESFVVKIGKYLADKVGHRFLHDFWDVVEAYDDETICYQAIPTNGYVYLDLDQLYNNIKNKKGIDFNDYSSFFALSGTNKVVFMQHGSGIIEYGVASYRTFLNADCYSIQRAKDPKEILVHLCPNRIMQMKYRREIKYQTA